ncbi:RNA polymerase sigma factor [Rugosimonospora africana]|uniref:Siderophore-interacting protein n=1 Tax=Rugosimonospora africana TaxID=556532 RepID=A0A8J3QMN2_9ACTN|nr:RNA polymerase sigma factor [Rugosimonospora africana]GIH12739.1 siderophore-interacting protein [Rugosimonospora africana]
MEKTIRVRVHDGDPSAFRELFDEYARLVYHHAFRLTANSASAEDVVSLTFLEAWRLRGRVDVSIDGSLRPWLLGIATNVAHNMRRAARRHDLALARLPRQPVEPDFAEEVAARIDNRERVALVQTAMQALRKPEREVLALCVGAGLDYAEAGEALGVPASTVRSRLSRARERLRKLVGTGKLRPPPENSRPPAGHGQVVADRTIAVRFAQETTR